jgi:hypothetical protein
MAGDDWAPDDWFPAEQDMFMDLLGNNAGGLGDSYLQELFDIAMFDTDISREVRDDAYDSLVDYLWNEYGIDFEDMFDWEDYREWYDSQG